MSSCWKVLTQNHDDERARWRGVLLEHQLYQASGGPDFNFTNAEHAGLLKLYELRTGGLSLAL